MAKGMGIELCCCFVYVMFVCVNFCAFKNRKPLCPDQARESLLLLQGVTISKWHSSDTFEIQAGLFVDVPLGFVGLHLAKLFSSASCRSFGLRT